MSAITVIEAALGEELGPDLIASIDVLPSERLVAMAQAYVEFAEEGTSILGPASQAAELRPLVTFQAMRTVAAKFGLGIDPKGFYQWSPGSSPDLVEDAIKRLLLYCHRLVLDDPFIYTCDYLKYGEPDGALRAEVRRKVGANLSLLSYLRPLVEHEIVVFVPQDRAGRAPAPDAASVSRIAAESDFGHFNPGPMHPYVQQFWSEVAFQSVKATLLLGNEFPSRFDFFFPDPVFVNAAVVELRGHRPESVGTAERHSRELNYLLEVHIPRLDDLTVADVLAIREQGDAFILWRDSLRSALGAASDVNARIDPNGERMRAIRDELEVAQARLRENVAKSPVLHSSSRGVLRLALGGLTDLMFAPHELIRHGVESTLEGAADTVLGWQTSDAPARHYSLFEPL